MSGRFLSTSYMQSIRNRVEHGDELLCAAFKKLVAAADEALEQPPLSIRDNGGSPWYRQDAIYVPQQDGVINAASNRKSGEMANRLSRVSIDLALGWQLTGDRRYADKAVELIHAWCINRDTYMFPSGGVVDSFTPGAAFGGDVVVFLAFHGFFLACYLLGDYDGWGMSARGAVKRWIKAMLAPQRELMFFNGREMYNNWEGIRLVYLARGALALDDIELLEYVFGRYGQILPMMMTDEGELPRETMRTRSMHYTLSALNHVTDIAEIARQYGIDLYDLSVNGRFLKKAIDYAAHYLLHIDQWPFEQIKPLNEEFSKSGNSAFAVFEMAFNRWGDRRYIEVIDAWGGRPVDGHATLLYGGERNV